MRGIAYRLRHHGTLDAFISVVGKEVIGRRGQQIQLAYAVFSRMFLDQLQQASPEAFPAHHGIDGKRPQQRTFPVNLKPDRTGDTAALSENDEVFEVFFGQVR